MISDLWKKITLISPTWVIGDGDKSARTVQTARQTNTNATHSQHNPNSVVKKVCES